MISIQGFGHAATAIQAVDLLSHDGSGGVVARSDTAPSLMVHGKSLRGRRDGG